MSDRYAMAQPMRIQARRGSPAEQRYYYNSALPEPWRLPKAIANGVRPRPLEDLTFAAVRLSPRCCFRTFIAALAPIGIAATWRRSIRTLETRDNDLLS